MGIMGKLEGEIKIKSSGDQFYELFGDKPHQVSNIIPQLSCHLHKGDFGKPGSIVSWDYILDGKKCVVKEIVEVDKEQKLVRFKVIDGDILKDFKAMLIGLQVIPKGEISDVKWFFEFEKLHDDGAYPTKELDYLIEITRDIEAHHLKA